MTGIAGGEAQTAPLLLFLSRVKLAPGVWIQLQAVCMQLGSFEKYIPIDKTLALQDSGSSPARRGEKKKEKEKKLREIQSCSALEWTRRRKNTYIEERKSRKAGERALPWEYWLIFWEEAGWAFPQVLALPSVGSVPCAAPRPGAKHERYKQMSCLTPLPWRRAGAEATTKRRACRKRRLPKWGASAVEKRARSEILWCISLRRAHWLSPFSVTLNTFSSRWLPSQRGLTCLKINLWQISYWMEGPKGLAESIYQRPTSSLRWHTASLFPLCAGDFCQNKKQTKHSFPSHGSPAARVSAFGSYPSGRGDYGPFPFFSL